MKNKSILVVEDEIIAMQYLVSILDELGYKKIHQALSSEEAFKAVKKEEIKLAFMDININDKIDGIECSNIINKEYKIPTIYTTAYNDSQTIYDAKESNIFGYISKPFSPNDVEATLSVALKLIDNIQRNEQLQHAYKPIMQFENNQSYNLNNKTFSVNSEVIELTKKESELLFHLCKNINQTLSYEMLQQSVWKDKDISSSTIRDSISRLKKKVSNLDIQNRANIGYILVNKAKISN